MSARAPARRRQPAEIPRQEHSIPWFWPLAAGIELGETGLRLFDENVKFVSELAKIEYELEPAWASANRVVREFDAMRLREFPPHARAGPAAPVVVAISAIGLILAAVYSLLMMQRAFFGPARSSERLADLNGRELTLMLSLAALLLLLGVYPQPVLDTSAAAMSGLQQLLAGEPATLLTSKP